MKKILTSVLLVIVMLTALVLPASAATGNLTAVAMLSEDGTQFMVNLIVKNNPGIIAIEASVKYDAKVLKLKSATNGEIFESIFMTGPNKQAIPYEIIWMEATASEDIKTNGVLATYTFEVLNSAALGKSQINFNITDVVNFKKDKSVNFTGCTFNINVKGVASDSQTSGQSSDSTVSDSTGTSSVDEITNDQTLVVQKPAGDPTSSDSATDTSSLEDTSSEKTPDNKDNDDDNDDYDDNDDDLKNNDRTLITLLTVGGVLLLGIGITIVALYFRKKSTKSDDKNK